MPSYSLEPFEASLAFNGFGKLVTLHRQPAGAADGQPVCLERGARHDTALARGYSTAEVRRWHAAGCGPLRSCVVHTAQCTAVLVGAQFTMRRQTHPDNSAHHVAIVLHRYVSCCGC